MKGSGFLNDPKVRRHAAVFENNGVVMFENAGSSSGSSVPRSAYEGFAKFCRCDLAEKQVTNSLRISGNCW